MKLSELKKLFIKNHLYMEDEGDAEFTHISCDSRNVRPGTLFFAKGAMFKPEYLFSALEKGAAGYICDKDYGAAAPHIMVSNIRLAMPLAAKHFYGDPTAKFPLVGVTGTKGKTTCAYMLKNIFTLAYGAEKTAIISTNEALSGTKKIEKSFTTPEALELYQIFDTFARDGVSAAVMEVSSQGLQYNRVEYADFDIGIFLNLSPDHVSPTEHKDFAEYKAAKKRLFGMCRYGIINIDDEHAPEMMEGSRCEKIYTVAIDRDADFRATDVLLSKKGVSFRLGGEEFTLNIPGEFNVYNALCAIAAAKLLGVSSADIRKGLAQTHVQGRMEILEKDGKTVIVDYAHNALSFNAVFDYVEAFYPESRKICVFGCQGNKALGRRVDLPEIAAKKADFLVLTSDDPAGEEPEKILEEMEKNLPAADVEYTKIVDREQAVKYAVSQAKAGDVIFLAGKGHEHTQQVKGKAVYYKGDMDCAKEALELE